MNESKDSLDKITHDEMIGAIERYGYLLEQRIEPYFEELGFIVEPNSVFMDLETMRNQELNLLAFSSTPISNDIKLNHFLNPYLICECENNHKPIVFFDRYNKYEFSEEDNFKFSGLPIKFKYRNIWIPINRELSLSGFHHYRTKNLSTQYCSFHKKKDSKAAWIALHHEEQHNSFMKLIKAIKFTSNEHYEYLYKVIKRKKSLVHINCYYPILVVQGELYNAYVNDDGETILEKAEHIKFLKHHVENNKSEDYLIDVVTEKYLPALLAQIEEEIDILLGKMEKKHKKLVATANSIRTELIADTDLKGLKNALEYNYLDW